MCPVKSVVDEESELDDKCINVSKLKTEHG